jgi:hypothetical protein
MDLNEQRHRNHAIELYEALDCVQKQIKLRMRFPDTQK